MEEDTDNNLNFREFCFSIDNFTSKKHKIEKNKLIYEWGDRHLTKKKRLISLDYVNDFTINLLFMPEGINCSSKTINTKDLNLTKIKHIKRLSVKIRPKIRSYWSDIMYGAGKVFLQYSGHFYENEKTSNIVIYHMCIQLKSIFKFIDIYNHKITCGIDDMYIGRAQEITTNKEIQSRSYKWTSTNGADIRTNDWKDYTHDIKYISGKNKTSSMMLKSILSSRHTENSFCEYIMDHDGYTNTYRVLPIQILEFKSITFYFYNFKHIPPTRISVEITSEEFKANPKCISRKIPEIKSTITIYYKNHMEIISVILTVPNFFKNLEFTRQLEMTTH